MFHPYESPGFESAAASKAEPKDMVLAVKLGGRARAYPIITMGYHRVVNDTVAGVPDAMTYCTLCHSGIAWDPVVMGEGCTSGWPVSTTGMRCCEMRRRAACGSRARERLSTGR